MNFNNYKTFLVDIWGVLHNGHDAYEGADKALFFLKSYGKVVLFSNTPLMPEKSKERLNEMGIINFDEILTAGKITKDWIEKNNINCKNVYLFGEEEVASPLLQSHNFVNDPEEADLVFVTDFPKNFAPNDSGLEKIKPSLFKLAQKGVKMICPCVDVISVSDEGIKYTAGKIAQEYKKIGGEVTLIGKPWPLIYEYAFKTYEGNFLTFGDGLGTDILGAKHNEIDGVWVKNGVHGDKLEDLPELFEEYGVEPKFSVEFFADIIDL